MSTPLEDVTFRREYRIFSALDNDGDGRVSRSTLANLLRSSGLLEDDPRLAEIYAGLAPLDGPDFDLDGFVEVISPAAILVERAAQGTLAIPDFEDFCHVARGLFATVSENRGGAQADYIPPLADVDPDQFGLAIVTVDGQRLLIGDARTDFSIQSTCKPFNYCFALEDIGEEKVHHHIGREPSGQGFNAYFLQRDKRPHNPMINAGAIMCASLIQPRLPAHKRFRHVVESWKALNGGTAPRFNAYMAMEEERTGDRNRALAYMMKNEGSFPGGEDFEDTEVRKALELYFKACSLEMTAEEMATAAATLANGGVCPATRERALSRRTVRNCLSLMYSCGMYDFSGEFAFSIGVPAKSGVGGAVLMVVPGLFGLCVWSPRLDEVGNSVRGVDFATRLVQAYSLHVFDAISSTGHQIDPRLPRARWQATQIAEALWAASSGALGDVRRLLVEGFDLQLGDYDRRTALHLAAAEGHVEVVEYLLSQDIDPNLVDRWGGTPLDDAYQGEHEAIIACLEAADAVRGNPFHLNEGGSALRSVPQQPADPVDVVELLWAAAEGRLSGIRRLIANGVPVTGTDYDGRTALHLAAAEGRVDVVRYLLAHGHPLQVRDRWGSTPLDEARREDRPETVALLEAQSPLSEHQSVAR